jgi:hypothetical protein
MDNMSDFQSHSATFILGVLTGALFFIAIITCVSKDEPPVEIQDTVSHQDYTSDEEDYTSDEEEYTPEFLVNELLKKKY